MHTTSFESLICPYLKGSLEGAVCRIENRFIREADETDIHVCMSEHFEFCPVLRCYNEEHEAV